MIRVLFIDVDGTLTDGHIYIANNGELFKSFDIKDGYGIHNILPNNGIIPVIITGRESLIVKNRCKELGINYVYQGVSNKLEVMKNFIEHMNFNTDNVAYIGDDLNDLECINYVKENGGLTAAPCDSADEVKRKVNYVCSKLGGNGAVREFIEYIITKNN